MGAQLLEQARKKPGETGGQVPGDYTISGGTNQRRARRGSGLQVIRNVIAPVIRNPRDGRVEGYDPNAKACQLPALPDIPDSRRLELLTDRQVDKFIRRVLETRAKLSDYDRWRMRMFPQLAGGAQGAGTMQGVESNPASASVPMVPFDQASKRGIEPGPAFTFTPGAGSITLGPTGLPAQGYLRAIEIDVSTAAVGTGGGSENSEDSPWDLLEVIRLQDTNGNQLDDLSGFALFTDNVYGGYAGAPDPRVDDFFKNEAEKNHSFSLMLVRELAPNGFGAIANMSASQAYKLTLRIAAAAAFYKKAPATKNEEFNLSVWLHFWQLPDDVDMLHRPQVQTPPFHGTTQYRWFAPENATTTNFNLSITQTGNEIRLINLIGRVAGKRNFEAFPEPFQFRWDTELLLIAGVRQLRKIARELTNDQVEVMPGVLPLPFNFGEGRFVGGSGVNSWLPTVTATRLQITGTAPKAGTVDVFVNDVSVAETNPALRPVTPGPGGYVAPTAQRLTPTG
jgi:hypothetical protein